MMHVRFSVTLILVIRRRDAVGLLPDRRRRCSRPRPRRRRRARRAAQGPDGNGGRRRERACVVAVSTAMLLRVHAVHTRRAADLKAGNV